MTDTQSEVFGIEKSASGKENGYIHHCSVVEHCMNYAACLARIDAIKAQKGMQDWGCCETAMGNRTCKASEMRKEELLQGRSIYFTPRGAIQKVVASAREWISNWNKTVKPTLASPAPRKVRDVIDAMGELGSFADAISTGESTATTAAVVALPGETPLQMARRIAAEKRK